MNGMGGDAKNVFITLFLLYIFIITYNVVWEFIKYNNSI